MTHREAISQEDLELVAAAKAIIRERYKAGWHAVGAALRTESGRVFTGVHLEASIGRIAICAEAVALGRAICEGESAVAAIVAVRHPAAGAANPEIQVIPPCGMCREMIADYVPAPGSCSGRAAPW